MKFSYSVLLVSLGIFFPNSGVFAETLKSLEVEETQAEIVLNQSVSATSAKIQPQITSVDDSGEIKLSERESLDLVSQLNFPTTLVESDRQAHSLTLPNQSVNAASAKIEPQITSLDDSAEINLSEITLEITTEVDAKPVFPVPTEEVTPETTTSGEITEEAETETTQEITPEEVTPETTISEEETVEKTTEDTEIEAEIETELSPEEIARQQKLIEADRLFLAGDIAAATQLYREAKLPFNSEIRTEIETQPEPIYELTELAPAGVTYWRLSEEGLAQELASKIFVPLKFLVEQHPEFIPGHIRYVEALQKYDRADEAIPALERAVALYPNEPILLQKAIEVYREQEKWLEASLIARQFALMNPEDAQAEEFLKLADENLARYQRHLRRKLRGNAIANFVTGAIGYAVTGNLFGPLSALDTTILMLRGESAVGSRLANQAQAQLPMVEDEEVLEYVRAIGNKLVLAAGRDDFDYEFYVIMSDRLNAFALPGGKIFINAGAILKSNSEAELAGLLAHELSHAVLSHGFQLVTEGNLTANLGQFIPFGGTAANLIVLNYSRDMEHQADVLGTRILVTSGYAADGLHNLMITLDEENDFNIPAWLSTHPNTEKRIYNLENLILTNGYNRYTYEGVARHLEIQQKVAELWSEYQETEEYQQREQQRQNLRY
ncbi:MAG: M48 family metallopeptidase [Oscillatoria sp. PMC 1068.18]|nr:M48 family metallopeptidase [Oscillatoria sp. PMC 1076.18]MEC4989707.1 M48 family metallopeptidase [Oscillatoria sp. PMC 1068.18]